MTFLHISVVCLAVIIGVDVTERKITKYLCDVFALGSPLKIQCKEITLLFYILCVHNIFIYFCKLVHSNNETMKAVYFHGEDNHAIDILN